MKVREITQLRIQSPRISISEMAFKGRSAMKAMLIVEPAEPINYHGNLISSVMIECTFEELSEYGRLFTKTSELNK